MQSPITGKNLKPWPEPAVARRRVVWDGLLEGKVEVEVEVKRGWGVMRKSPVGLRRVVGVSMVVVEEEGEGKKQENYIKGRDYLRIAVPAQTCTRKGSRSHMRKKLAEGLTTGVGRFIGD